MIGRRRLLLNTLDAISGRCTVPLVVTCAAPATYDAQPSDFEAAAQRIGADFLCVGSLHTPAVLNALRAADCAVAISADWPVLIRQEALDCFPYGVWNAHGGELPRYRGASPIAWAILDGAEAIGVTVHQMDAGELDAGPIIVTARIPLPPTMYIGHVFDCLGTIIPHLFVQAVDALAAGNLTPVPQAGFPLRGYPRLPEDARVTWGAGAEHLGRLVRASAEPLPGAFCDFNGERLTIWRAHPEPWEWADVRAVPGQVMAREGDAVHVATADGSLVLTEVEYKGQRGPASAVIRSNRDRLR